MEVAGLVLAIIPLCITALEHHEAITRGRKALFRYQTLYSSFAGDLSICLVELDQSVKRVLRAAGVSDDDQTDSMIKSCKPDSWTGTEQESKLKAHFGEPQYSEGFAAILRKIQVDVLAICQDLDVLPGTTITSDKVRPRAS